MGIPVHFHSDYPVHKTCKILSEFALEYRTTRERVIQTMEKKKAAKERKRKEHKAAKVAAALAEAATPYGIESFDSVIKPIWKGIRTHRGKGLAAFLKAIGYLIPLMDAEYANYYTR